jgi:hypothetical protein
MIPRDVFMRAGRGDMNAVALHAIVLMLMSASVMAQTDSSSAVGGSRFFVGPVALSPSIVLRDIGVDSNILDEAEDPKQDFTFTLQPRLRAAVPFGPTQLTGSVTAGLVYYATYKNEQSINRRYETRFESTTRRLRPFLAAALNQTRERTGYEIDAHVLRKDTSISGGAQLQLTGITSLTGSYRRATSKYGDNEQFLGIALASQLDQRTDLASAGMKWAITPLTTLSLDVERQRDRFDSSPVRDADSVRVIPAVQFAPDAVITGRISAGFRDFNPRDPLVEAFRGFVGAVNVSGTFLTATRVSVEATRDVMYSFDPTTPYFLVDSGHLTVSQAIGGPFDVIGLTGLDRLRYYVVEGLPFPGRVDSTRTVGGGVGIRVSPSLRFTFIYDLTERSSQLDRRAFDRRRLIGSLTFEP